MLLASDSVSNKVAGVFLRHFGASRNPGCRRFQDLGFHWGDAIEAFIRNALRVVRSLAVFEILMKFHHGGPYKKLLQRPAQKFIESLKLCSMRLRFFILLVPRLLGFAATQPNLRFSALHEEWRIQTLRSIGLAEIWQKELNIVCAHLNGRSSAGSRGMGSSAVISDSAPEV